jgi:hypothetical protein
MRLRKHSAQTARALLDRVLDRPSPAALVQSLPASTLLKLIERVGLEDLGDVIALLAPAQLQEVLDLDLWTSMRVGDDETFDAGRFALWLALLVEQSPALAAKKLKALDFDLVALGLSGQLFVIDIDSLAQRMSQADDEDALLEKALEAGLYHEFEQYRVIARDSLHFDALLAVLVELNARDFGYFSLLLERLCTISTEVIEDNGGLYNVLTAEEMVASDVAGEREDRREQRGHVPKASARALLGLAFITNEAELCSDVLPDAITRAHLRASDSAAEARADRPKKQAQSPAALAADAATQRLVSALEEVLREAPAPRLPRMDPIGAPPLGDALSALCAKDDARYERCVLEAAYLANVVLTALSTTEAPLLPSAAADIAFSLCAKGAGAYAEADGAAEKLERMVTRLAEAGLVKFFLLGVKRLCAEPKETLSPALRALVALAMRPAGSSITPSSRTRT